MAYLHLRRHTRIQIPNPIATLCYAEHVHMAQTQTWMPTPHFCIGQESESKSIPLFESGKNFIRDRCKQFFCDRFGDTED